jgi:hypothetical protein
MLRKVLIAIALALTTALVASSVAFAVVVQTVQGESMRESTSQAGPFTGVEGVSMMRWNSGATTNAVASAQVNPLASVEQLVVRARQGASGGGTLAVLLDGQVVGTFSPSTSGFAPHTITLANPLSAGSHTLAIRPNATLPVRADVDYVELHDTGGTPLPPAACADGQDNDLDGKVDYGQDEGCSSSTDNDETNAPPGTCTGTTVSPTNNLENIIDNPGNYCLSGDLRGGVGVYQESDKQITINADHVTVRNVPGQRVEIRGRVRTNDGSANVRFIGSDVSSDFEGIKLDNSYAPLDWSTSGGMGHFTAVPHLIRGSGTVFENVEITSSNVTSSNDALPDPWYNSQPSTPARASGTCILVADGTDGRQAADFRLAYSDVHNCGNKPNDQFGDIGQHAVYLSGALRAEIAHNMIYGGATRGVQQRSNTDNGHIYGNIIHENYVGVGHDEPSTSGNITENNVVTLNENKNIRNLSDAGPNTVRNNCGFGEPIPNGQNGNVTYSNNVNVSTNPYGREPSPSNDAVVSNSTCSAKLPAGSPFLP